MLAKREVGAAGSFLHSQGWEQLKDWEESRINLQPWLFLLFFPINSQMVAIFNSSFILLDQGHVGLQGKAERSGR